MRNTEERRENAVMSEFRAKGMTVYDLRDEKSRAEHDRKILGFEGESQMGRVLAEIGTRMIETSHSKEYDVGMVVSVKSSDAADYTSMVESITKARTIDELRRVAEVYRGLPGALALAEACADTLGYKLEDVSA